MSDSTRNIKDGELIVSRALPGTGLPGTGATVTSTALDLEGEALGATAECVEAVIEIPATPNLADNKSITISLEDSADNSTFSAIAEAGSAIITGSGGSGADKKEVHLKLPTTTRRYLRASATAETSAGDSTGVDFEFSIRG
eukprot:Seg12982.2 transcript_id=Seg12982.2/GoldUCD/mRNA.D3Y31 product="hypothetical protein" protein_id=Seg12982.2/GoldUCD/D3Y31